MPRTRIAPGTVGAVSVVPLGTHGNKPESVIPTPTDDDGKALAFPKNLRVGDTYTVRRKLSSKVGGVLVVEHDWTVTEHVVTRWRGLARVIDTEFTPRLTPKKDGEYGEPVRDTDDNVVLHHQEFMVRRWEATKAAAEAATRKAGLDKLAQLSAERQAAIDMAATAADGDMTTDLAALVDEAMRLVNESGKLAVRTRQNYGYSAKLIREHAIGSARPRDVDVAMLRRCLSNVAAEHGTVVAKQVKAILRKALDLAVESRALKVPGNLVLALPKDAIPNVQVQDRGLDHRTSLTDDQVTALLAALQADPLAAPLLGARTKSPHGQTKTAAPNGQDVADLLALTFATGMRVGEATALRWADIDLATVPATADVTGTVVYVNGTGAVRQEKTKSKAGNRAVPLRADIVEMLTERAALFGVDLASPTDLARPVFPSPQAHDKFRDPSNLAKVVRAAFTRHGHPSFSSHQARRYRITSLSDRKVPASKIADLVGHAKMDQTLAYIGRGRSNDPEVVAAL